MNLYYDKTDLSYARKLRDERLRWLIELGATDIATAPLDAEGFLFSYAHGDEHYRRLVGNRPGIADRPEHREELSQLDGVLRRLQERQVRVPMPRTWTIGIDDPLPDDLTFPLFVRTPKSSWKRGGTQARAANARQLIDEMAMLRRVFGWDAPILAREWIDVAVAGRFMFGDAPYEVRVWVVDQQPAAWSFHYLHVVASPAGFPPSAAELQSLADMAGGIGTAFASRLIAVDFIRDSRGAWWFLEAGPGAAAGTAHEAVFKYVAERLRGGVGLLVGDAVGGPL